MLIFFRPPNSVRDMMWTSSQKSLDTPGVTQDTLHSQGTDYLKLLFFSLGTQKGSVNSFHKQQFSYSRHQLKRDIHKYV